MNATGMKNADSICKRASSNHTERYKSLILNHF